MLEAVKVFTDLIPEIEIEKPRPLMRELPPADEFPIHALGDVLGNAAKAIQDKTQSPMAIAGQSVLAAATLAVQPFANVVLPTGGKKPLSCFFITIAATGERKSACDSEALWAINKHEAKLNEGYNAKLPSYQNDFDAWKKSRDVIVNKAKGNRAAIKDGLDKLGAAPLPPLHPMVTCTEPSFEGLCNQFKFGQPSLGLFASEGGQFVGGYGMSDEKQLQTATALSSVWDGEPIKRVRSGDGSYTLYGRRLSVHLMMQPDVSDIMLGNSMLASQGLLSRFLVTAPDSTSGTRFWREPSVNSDSALKRYGARLLDIMETPLPLAEGKENELEPRDLPLAPEAKQVAIAFYNEVEKNNSNGGELEPIRGLANKLLEHACRLAGVLAMVDNIHCHNISKEHMAAGILLAKHYAAEALRLFGSKQVSPDLMLAQKLLSWIKHSWQEDLISAPDVYQLAPISSIRDAKTAKRIISTLAEHGYLIQIPEGGVVKGEKRREVWRIVRD